MNIVKIRKALNPAYRKYKPLRKDVNQFIFELKNCINAVKLSDENKESEEHIKSHFVEFFKSTFYKDHYINTKDKIDLAIYLDSTVKSDVGVIIETKKPSNKTEFLKQDDINKKALHELLLYYLRERVDKSNNNIKHLIATNGYEWYFFKAEDFYNLFYKNSSLIKEYSLFRDGLKDTTKNELFYNEIARKYVSELEDKIPFVYISFYETNLEKLTDSNLNSLFKIFSDVHILGRSFGNDSNQLNKVFYNELLHIIGLEETKDEGKRIIKRKSEKNRDYGSLLENTIFHLEDRDYLHKIKNRGAEKDKSFNIGLDLCLTWINRILFLKLLESQLLTYHKGDYNYKFLNSTFLKGYDDLNDLFFSALAKQEDTRHAKFKDKYKYIPYLNSSLFEPSLLEEQSIEISSLNDDEISVFDNTVLRNTDNKKFKGKLKTLDYLFKFLDAYDFAADGNEGIVEGTDVKTLINASVLGLIFEKINGYKDGSFYTPAYITMYMCKEVLRRTIIKKFNESENPDISSYDDLKAYCHKYFKPKDVKRFNSLVNEIRICDPAVGSGHFLVSALNELIFIKNELGILTDKNGVSLKCDIEIVNDELYILDAQGKIFEYTPREKHSTIIQKTLFHEKQILIENCLFGVDINPNSVKICRLRLWIELLKNSYYAESGFLQTLPNIDINIKNGNSLISRFKLSDNLKRAFKAKDIKYSFKDYKNAVYEYKNANSKDYKRKVLRIIEEVKNNFTSTLSNKFLNDYQKAHGNVTNEEERQKNLKVFGQKITKQDKAKLKKLKIDAEKKFLQKEEIINNVIYQNAFEWRFEFPEVLNDEGDYIGFDAIIGNPPYIQLQKMGEDGLILEKANYCTFTKAGDIYSLFYELGHRILKPSGLLIYITSNKWMRSAYGKSLRHFLANSTNPKVLIDFSGVQIFDTATVETNILLFYKQENDLNTVSCIVKDKDLNSLGDYILQNGSLSKFGSDDSWVILSPIEQVIKEKIERISTPLKEWDVTINFGIKTGFNEAFIIDDEKRNELISLDPKSVEIIRPLLRGRDIQRYLYDFAELYLITTFPSLKINIESYPAVKEHLLSFGIERLSQSGKKGSRKKTNNQWFETQDSISYWDDFYRQKIVW
ncbi:Eco57I restriction-modification methylase domain-containing protein, partial [Zhouia sp. PK063]|uniref:type IIG restriction enzyme/methyltransferase n=1 Tax=Zhouia sp. PK063 TaxID=3373602 RepID=UPI0037AB8F98